MRGVTTNSLIDYACITFQLTRLMRGVTSGRFKVFVGYNYFNSHASCEA